MYNLNLQSLRTAVIDRMFDLMDLNGDGGIDYKEFFRVLSAPSIYLTQTTERKPRINSNLTHEKVRARSKIATEG